MVYKKVCDFPKLYDERKRKARKQHRCYGCRDAIDRGEIYHDIKGLWDGTWNSFKYHIDCFDLFKKLNIDSGGDLPFDEFYDAVNCYIDNNLLQEFNDTQWTKETITLLNAKYDLDIL